MRILETLDIQTRRMAGVVQDAADAHHIAAKDLSETARAATGALTAVALVAIAALALATVTIVFVRNQR